MTRRRATYQDAHLVLDLYEARREDLLRQARDWFIHEFHVRNYDEYQALCPPGSPQHAWFRMVVTYWDMAASMIAAGVLEPTLFFKSGRELLLVWQRIRDVVPAIRAANRDERTWHNLERVARAYVAWLNEHGPDVYPSWAAGIAALKRTDR
jgi:hypothetical protein